jgi:DNA invertase Pin-like site-specific DNA recombinase
VKLSEGIIKEVVKHIKAGNYAKDVMAYLNIDESAIYRWKNEGNKIKEEIESDKKKLKDCTEYEKLCYKLCKSLKRAEKAAIMKNVARIQRAAREQWQAAAWYLERRAPKDWAKRDYLKQDVNIKPDKELKEIFETND